MKKRLISFVLALTMMAIVSSGAMAAPQETLLLSGENIQYSASEITVDSIMEGEDAKNIVSDLKSSIEELDMHSDFTPEFSFSIE